MTFNELVAEVLAIVKRPDLQSRIESAVRAATLKAHNQDFFYRDLVESGIQFDTPAHIQNFLPSDIFGANFRKLKYLRYWNYDATDAVNFGRPGAFIEAIDVENSTDAYGYIKSDVFYMAGTLIQIRTSCELSHCLGGAYLYPSVASADTFSSWIAEEHPQAIIYEAARRILIELGKAENANSMAQLVAEEYLQLKLNSVNKPGE